MIFDSVDHLSRYGSIPYLDDVIAFLKRPDVLRITDPEVEIKRRDLFVRIMRYHPKSAQENKFETHRVYADVQVLLYGKEIMEFAPQEDLEATTAYDTKGDYQFYNVERNIGAIVVNKGEFMVFFPGEAHRPSCLCPDYDGENLKLVFKIRMGKA
jgi:biofilm protein TabA